MSTHIEELNPGLKDLGRYEYGWADSDTAGATAKRGLNEDVNRIISGFADGHIVHFLNINEELLEPDGSLSKEVMPDLLHPNARGYAIWQRAMDRTLQKLLALERTPELSAQY